MTVVAAMVWTSTTAQQPSASLDAMPDEIPLIELQLNAEFWQLLSWQEAVTLSEFVRDRNESYKRVPLQYLFPIFRQVESIDARSASGERLSVEVRSLENSYLRLSPVGLVDLVLDGELQENPVQLNIYGEMWPENKIEIWLEKEFEKPFLLSELELYQRFHNISVELVIVEDLLRDLSRSIYQNSNQGRFGSSADLILADNQTVKLLHNRLRAISGDYESLSYLELFGSRGEFYAAPFALEPYCIIYNSDLLDLQPDLKLSDLFGLLMEAKQGLAPHSKDPYFVAFEDDSIAFTLLFESFLKGQDFRSTGFKLPDAYTGLQYLRTQGQRGLLKSLNYAEDLFAWGEAGVLITRSGARPRILAKAKAGKNGNKQHIKSISLPYNDLRENAISAHPRIWSLSVLRSSKAEQQALGLSSFLLRGAVQSQFDLSEGILPSNTQYYPFYQRSVYYPLLPKGEVRYSMSTEELWEYGIERRRDYRGTEELNELLKDRIPVLLESDVDLELLLSDLEQQWQKAELPNRRRLFD